MQIEKCKMLGLRSLSERLETFAVEIIRIGQTLEKTFVGRKLIGQLMNASTSASANYEEACAAESRSDSSIASNRIERIARIPLLATAYCKAAIDRRRQIISDYPRGEEIRRFQ
jgi:hypothetical protein